MKEQSFSLWRMPILTVSFLALIFTTMSSCHHEMMDDDTIQIDVAFGESKNVPFRVSQMIDTVEYHQLKASQPVGFINDIKVAGNFIYLCDYHSGIIYVFNRQGEMHECILHRGRAQNEYINIGKMDVDPDNGDIHVYDVSTRRILEYTPSGEFLRQSKCEDVVTDFLVMPGGRYLMYTPYYTKGGHRGLWMTDSCCNFLKQLVSIDDDYRLGGVFPRYLTRIDNNTAGLIGGEDKDNIYAITGDSVSARYHINYNITIPLSLKKDELANYEEHKGEIYTKTNYFENTQWLIFQSFDMENVVWTFYDKLNDVCHNISREEDLVRDIFFSPNFLYMDADAIYGMIYPYQIADLDEFSKYNIPLEQGNDNPILVVYKLKQTN